MKKRDWATLAGLILGGAIAIVQGPGQTNVMAVLMKPWAALGQTLRAWSLSGAGGNAAAWAVLTVLSLLPAGYILLARRKRKQAGDGLWLLSSLGVFAGLFLLINPTLAMHPLLAGSMANAPELACAGPTAMMLSLLLASALTRWSGGLEEGRTIVWLQLILTGAMSLTAYAVGAQLTENFLLIRQAAQPVDMIDAFLGTAEQVSAADASIALMMDVVLLIPAAFMIRLMDAAVSLTGAMKGDWFNENTELLAGETAKRARYALIASAGCTAARNILILLLAQQLTEASFRVELPVAEMLTACGAMLLARMLKAACKVKRYNDLMI